MIYKRIPPDEYAANYRRCSVCGHYVKIGSTPEGGEYDPPSPAITGCTFTVYGRCAIQLAGQAAGSVLGDGVTTAPRCAPVLLDLTLTAGKQIIITTSGGVGYGPGAQSSTAEGNTSSIVAITAGDQNGISDITAPYNALLGVFTTDDVPSGTAPAALDFTLLATRDYTTLAPEIRQTFFIGIGRTSADAYRQVTVPATATKLYLGAHDSADWTNNTGAITGNAHQATHFNHVDKITTAGVFLNDRAANFGCPFCGSPAWRSGGKAGDLTRLW